MADPTATLSALQRIDQPTLLLHGDRDVLVPLASARRMHTAHPDWRFEVARGVGHLPMLEAPAWTADTIVDWLTHEGAVAATRSTGPARAALS